MGKAAAARKLASAAAFGGGGLSVLGAGLYGVLRGEAALARRVIGNAGDEPPPDSTGWYGRGRPGPAIKVALLGDSSAAGYGVERLVETPGAFLASGLAAEADRRVHLRTYAQGRRPVLRPRRPDRPRTAERPGPRGDPDRRQRRHPPGTPVPVGALPRRGGHAGSRDAGAKVLVGTCPDLGTVKPIPPPLKQVARSMSRRLAAAQAIAAVEQGGVAVSLGSILGPDFAAAPGGAVRPRPVPSRPPRATARSPRCSCRQRPQRPGLRRRRARGVPAARARCRSPRRPSALRRRPAPSWETRRASGWSCAGVPGCAPTPRPLRVDERRSRGRRQRRMIARIRSRLV